MRECEICGWNIEHRYISAKYCRFCSVIIKRLQTSVSDLNRPPRLNYHNWYHKYRRKGTTDLGSHPYKESNKIVFDREQEIIRKEKRFIFKTINRFRKIIPEYYLYDDQIFSFKITVLIEVIPLKCPICDEPFIIQEPIHSYDYNEDGFVMPFCSNCGLVKTYV